MATFQYTSGTTRKLPEAIRHTHRAIVLVCIAALYGTGVRPGDEFFCPSSPAWGHGLWHGTLAPLALGVTTGVYDEFTRVVGTPGAYDYGLEHCSRLTHHLTNWMGDDAILRRASCKIRRHNPLGDLLVITGKVTRKFVEDGRRLVEYEWRASSK